MEGELGLVINIDLERVLHEPFADEADLLVQGGREHHDLLVVSRKMPWTSRRISVVDKYIYFFVNNDRKETKITLLSSKSTVVKKSIFQA